MSIPEGGWEYGVFVVVVIALEALVLAGLLELAGRAAGMRGE